MPGDAPLLVVDTNVVVRAFANPTGVQAEIVQLLPRALQVAVTARILTEYVEVTERPKVTALFRRSGVTATEYDAFVARLVDLAVIVEPTSEPPPCRDEKDRPFLHCAVFVAAEFLVTHDKDLLVQGIIGPTRIVAPWAFLDWFRQES